MARALGVELTEAAVRILLLEENGKRPRVLSFHETPIPFDPKTAWEERAARALRDALSGAKVSRANAVASLDSGDAILREVSLPFKGDDQIRKTVRFEMESQIHNYTIEQLIVAHYKTGETDKGSLLLAAAVPKAFIEKRLKIFQDAGVDPVALDLDVCALFNAMLHAGAIETDDPHLLIYGSSKFTKLILVEGKRPRSIRTIRFSLPSPGRREGPPSASGLTPAPGAQVSLEFGPSGPNTPVLLLDEADTRRFRELDPDVQSALVVILAKEISRFLLANAASAQPTHILLSGEFENEETARRLETATRIPVRTCNLLEKVEVAAPAPAAGASARMGVPLGLALKGVGIDALGMDFRQEEFSYRRKFEALKTTALVTVELAIVFLAAVALYLYFKQKDLRGWNERVLEAQRRMYEDVTTLKLADPVMAYPRFKEHYQSMTGTLAKGAPGVRSAREAWRDLFTAVERLRVKYQTQTLGDGALHVEFESLDIQQTTTPGNETFTLSLRGKIRNLEFAEALKTEVRTIELLREADYSGPIVPLEGGLYQFMLRASRKGS